ncbi:MAG: peptide deformylase [Chloroflexi bacterium]|nr:peptide deformylase [Chloroflexota bacterium]
MSLRKIRVFPDPILRKKCKPVKLIDSSIKKLSHDMLETLEYVGGIGLAANQVGVLKRVVTLHLPEEDHRILINPEITKSFGTREVKEACLSFPGYQGLVKLSMKVKSRWLDINGSYYKLSAEDLLSQVLEHEIDHLNGILYIDHLLAHEKLNDAKQIGLKNILADQKLDDTKSENQPHIHDVDINLIVDKENTKSDDYEHLETKLDLSLIYSDSSMEDLKYDLHNAGYLSDLDNKN